MLDDRCFQRFGFTSIWFPPNSPSISPGFLPSLLCPSVVSSHPPAVLGSFSLPLPLSFSLLLLLYLPPALSCALSPHRPATSSESPPPPRGLFSALLFGVSRKPGSTHTRWQGGLRTNADSFPSKFSEARGS